MTTRVVSTRLRIGSDLVRTLHVLRLFVIGVYLVCLVCAAAGAVTLDLVLVIEASTSCDVGTQQ